MTGTCFKTLRTTILLTITAISILLGLSQTVAASEAETDQQIESLVGSAPDFKELFYAFQSAVAEGKSDIAVSLVAYPITITIGGERTEFRSEDELLDSYDEVFTPSLIEVIAAQNYGSLFVNADGIMIGNGEVWINGICDDQSCQSVTPRVIAIQPNE